MNKSWRYHQNRIYINLIGMYNNYIFTMFLLRTLYLFYIQWEACLDQVLMLSMAVVLDMKASSIRVQM